MNVRKTITTSALALGVLAGSAGVANAMTAPASEAQPAPIESTVEDQTQAESPESEADESTETDGIDHEFEGEETGENGDGVPDADDDNEAPE